MNRPLPKTLFILMLALISVACNDIGTASGPQTIESTPTPTTSVVDFKNKGRLAYIEHRLAWLEKRVVEMPADSTTRVHLAAVYQELARLTGNLAPHRRAIFQLNKALEIQPRGIWKLVQAGSYFALHDLPAVKRVLEETRQDLSTTTSYQLLNGDYLLLKGQYGKARAIFETVLARKPGFGVHSRLAHLTNLLNEHEESLQHWNDALTFIPPPRNDLKAWVHTMRGLTFLHRGRLLEARAEYVEAVTLEPRYVLALEHLAQVYTLLGDNKRALGLYLDVLKLTRNPEFLQAIAEIYTLQGKRSAATKLIAEAKAAYQQLLKQFPTASWGHAAGFYLGVGNDRQLGIRLLKKDVELRPNARTYRVLARALLDAGDVSAALAAIRTALNYPARSAQLHWVASLCFAKSRRHDLAEKHRKLALAINPKQVELADVD